MRPLLLVALLATAVHAQPAPDPGPAPSAEGVWDGIVRMPGQTMGMSITLDHAGDGWTGTASAPDAGMRDVSFDRVEVAGDSLRMQILGGMAVIAGRFAAGGDYATGELRYGGTRGTFALARPGSPQALAIIEEIGAWKVPPSPYPDSARIVTEDITRFWAALDASTPDSLASVLQRDYFDPATPGLQDFLGIKIGSVERMARAVNAHPRFYASIRPSTLRIADAEPEIRAAFRRMEALYPDATFPDVYFVVGAMSAGGTASQRGLLIGAEFSGRTPDMPLDELGPWYRAVISPVEEAPLIVAHELIHYQQDFGVSEQTLLVGALREGSADYLGEMISGGNIDAHIHAWADPQEEAVWCAFQAEMDGDDTSDWIANGASENCPAGLDYGDLGYYVGYKIAEAYHERARAAGRDDSDVVRAILHLDDARAFLAESGYAERFACRQ